MQENDVPQYLKQNVSRETLARLALYAETLKDWNARFNLVSPASLSDVWSRHIWDSAQLVAFIPENAHTLADLGSGAGFPGLVLALLLEGRTKVTLFEATRKKCDFLAAAAGGMGVTVEIVNERIEQFAPRPFHIITSRACAPLPKLLGYASRCMGPKSRCLFQKGENWRAEVEEAEKNWRMQLATHPSQTHNNGIILEITHVKPISISSRQTGR